MKRILPLSLAVLALALSSCQIEKPNEKPTEKLPEGPNPVVVLETTMGTIKLELFEDKAPVTVKNFLAYVDEKHYDGTIFHRVIPDFMIQGGGFDPGMKKERATRPPIKNESGNNLPNVRGTVAMARTNAPDSATSQFFINVQDNRKLDRASSQDGVGYCVFGRVVEGMDVVDAIRVVPTHSVKVPEPRSPFGFSQHDDVPEKDVVILTVRRVDPNSPTSKD